MAMAGKRDRRVRIEAQVIDADGERTGAWAAVAPVATFWARIQPLRGSETVMSQRLQGSQPVVIALLACRATKAIDNSFRLVATDTLQIYDITSDFLTETRGEIEIAAVGKAGNKAVA